MAKIRPRSRTRPGPSPHIPAAFAAVAVDELPRPVVGVASDFAHGETIPFHRHRRGQLVYACSGVMTVATREGTWVVPPQRAVWVPGGVEHRIRMSGEVGMRTAYLAPEAGARLPGTCCVVAVSPLLQQLLIRLVALPQPYPLGGAEERLVEVLLDELATLPVSPLDLPLGSDPRLRRVVDALLESPEDERGLAGWAACAGASPRTLARLFQRETGMSFGAWRRQLRLLRSLERLAAGEPVTSVALALGYDSTSAFIAMFRRNLGRTPGGYFRSAVDATAEAASGPAAASPPDGPPPGGAR
jgi:AraC-like DNA-binding protein/quercetin dioxygenase-like cupin family protein